jgi:hypothetical protein
MFSFPKEKPSVPSDNHGWFDAHLKAYLKPLIQESHTIIELGAFVKIQQPILFQLTIGKVQLSI